MGFEAQQADVRRWSGDRAVEVGSYTEVESGKNCDRPKFAAALAHARAANAVLVVANLSRMGRNVAFLSALMESGLDFVCCDMPSANRFGLHIMAAVAEEEVRAVSIRVKAALQAAKARGVKLGTNRDGHPCLTPEARKRGCERAAKVNTAKREKAVAWVRPLIVSLRGEGLTLVQVAERLNGLGYTTRRGKAWGAVQVFRILETVS